MRVRPRRGTQGGITKVLPQEGEEGSVRGQAEGKGEVRTAGERFTLE